jgi:hypothetical protein
MLWGESDSVVDVYVSVAEPTLAVRAQLERFGFAVSTSTNSTITGSMELRRLRSIAQVDGVVAVELAAPVWSDAL